MDWKQFISSVVGSLAWPAAVAFLIYVFRQPIEGVIARLTKLKGGGVEAEFGQYVEKAESAALRADLSVTPSTGASSDWPSSSGGAGWGTTGRSSSDWGAGMSSSDWGASTPGESSPRAAVIEAWLSLEREIQSLARAYGVKPGDPPLSTRQLVDQLVSQGVIGPPVAEVIARLRRARDAAVHEENYKVGSRDAAEYVELAAQCARTLQASYPSDLTPATPAATASTSGD
jgi:hypothetical protein